MSEQFQNVFVDRTGWSPGPWDGELDRYEWKSEHGFTCLMLRQETSGHWCGYVGVEPGHPWHRKFYSDLDVHTHGGLTYASECAGKVCHVPAPGEPEHLWWVGFDCAHYQDLRPFETMMENRFGKLFSNPGATYRDAKYVRERTESVAEQARGAVAEEEAGEVSVQD